MDTSKLFNTWSLWLIILIIFFVLLYQLSIVEFIRFRKIPGLKAYPIIGTPKLIMMDADDLFETIKDCAKTYYPIYKMVIGTTTLVALTSPNDIELVISQMKHLHKELPYTKLKDWLKEGLLLSNGPKWQRRRKLLTPTFHFTILNQFTNIFIDESNKLVKDIEKVCNEPVNVLSVIANYTLQSICETAMGTKLDQDKAGENYKDAIYKYGAYSGIQYYNVTIFGPYINNIKNPNLYGTMPIDAERLKFLYRMLHLITDRYVTPWQHSDLLYMLTPNYWKSAALIKYFHKFTSNVIKQRQLTFNLSDVELKENNFHTRKKMAMLDLLLLTKIKEHNIDDRGIQEEVDTFMFEGHDTVAASITFTLMLLANHNEAQKEIREELISILNGSTRDFSIEDLNEMKYLERVIKESLRLYPSVPLIARSLSEDVITTSGYFLPKGTNVVVGIYLVHHDENLYENPEHFDPDRFLNENLKGKHPYAYIPFSAGPRNCIGQKFAMLEMKSAIATILRNFDLFPIDTPGTIRLKNDVILRTTKPILVEFKPRGENSF